MCCDFDKEKNLLGGGRGGGGPAICRCCNPPADSKEAHDEQRIGETALYSPRPRPGSGTPSSHALRAPSALFWTPGPARVASGTLMPWPKSLPDDTLAQRANPEALQVSRHPEAAPDSGEAPVRAKRIHPGGPQMWQRLLVTGVRPQYR